MKIIDTLQAKIIIVLGDHFPHDADVMADCSLDILSLFSQYESEKQQELVDRILKEVIGEDDDSSKYLPHTDERYEVDATNELRAEQRKKAGLE